MNRSNAILILVTMFCLSLSIVLFIENRELRAESARWCAVGDRAVMLLGKYQTALEDCADKLQAQVKTANLLSQEATL